MTKNHLITKNDVAHIATLARIQLTDDELQRYTKELESILEYVGQLNEVDTRSVEPTAQVSGEKNRMREDVLREEADTTKRRFVDAAPMHDEHYVKVKAVFE